MIVSHVPWCHHHGSHKQTNFTTSTFRHLKSQGFIAYVASPWYEITSYFRCEELETIAFARQQYRNYFGSRNNHLVDRQNTNRLNMYCILHTDSKMNDS